MSVDIAITKIKEDEFVFRNEDIKKVDEKKLTIFFNVGFDWKLEDENFSVKLTIHYSYNLKGSDIELVRFSTTTGFDVKGLKEILKVDGNKFQLPDFFMTTFISTALSSGRGMLAYKLAGTFLADYYLPLIDPKDFISHIQRKLSVPKAKSNRKKPLVKSRKIQR